MVFGTPRADGGAEQGRSLGHRPVLSPSLGQCGVSSLLLSENLLFFPPLFVCFSGHMVDNDF